MIRIFAGMAVGAVLGALSATAVGMALGCVGGMAAGAVWYAVRRHAPGVAPNTPVTRVERKVLCVPRGEPADCRFVRDLRTGKIVDVEHCTLSATPDVRCPKQCVTLMRDSASV